MIKQVKRKEQKGEEIDFKIERRHFTVQLFSYYSLIQWLADIMVGSFFILGSILNFLNVETSYSYICYLIGSLAMTVRPTIKVIKHIKIWRIKNKNEP